MEKASLIKNISYLVTRDDEDRVLDNVNICIQNRK